MDLTKEQFDKIVALSKEAFICKTRAA